MRELNIDSNFSAASVEASSGDVDLKSVALAKIYNNRASRDELRASMIAKARDVVEKGIESLEMVTVIEHR
ncbi:hypothetical protein C1Y08_00610 [Pseudomonas sp. FW306-02-F02-AA]|uniref:Uncharacterized protein n=1 Tax=Pseudomonas fluorescens TaxID=294 RepID=A0A0N9VTV3_PSEFL|nr:MULTISPECIES: hypothetical protein [Pseudomonas]ALI04007.1 hypothetical protein AO353_24130 [Pseudomonas fluorescens]PMZ04929.1 hypothetical protein C1Y07_07475 [Pseudomonas sp. FW306-02-F02-AB]PMZ12094.1 hypothetical protein C1Y06_01415 [Pseudomonas sp. FW306-02-H06C]PMZ17854.1 hypothetical protein C1Y08_00610 [Pseudomonas sp. FW306-02-F02-AA]PMZ23886.1 hypothetical protein C1Y09_00610 [Pseudomonas sp. FW306-02-F08-AA]